MIVFTRKSIRFGEVHFSEEPPQEGPKVDLVQFIGILEPREPAGWRQAHTILIDLTKDNEVLLKEMDSGTRYEIKRALHKDNLVHAMPDCSAGGVVDEFCNFYDDFARSKALRPVFRPRLYELARKQGLLLSSMSTNTGQMLVQHMHLMFPERAMLLYSASKFRDTDDSNLRSLIGRANRLLHWEDMLAAKQRGIALYDLCGVDVTNKSPETTRIAQFKQSFGGRLATWHARTQATSLKGRLVKAALKLAGREL